MAHTLSRGALARLQSQPERVRNMCILAHVDHGKTTLSDSLLSSNGIISAKLAGRVRFLDSTEEEQARGITMKASAIALLHSDEPHRELRKAGAAPAPAPAPAGPGDATSSEGGAAATPTPRAATTTTTAAEEAPAAAPAPGPAKVPYFINLIDSPGHVDFSMDVAAAARLCDGALVVVDAVEGMCIQTHAVLRTAWAEGVRPALVLNKVDRLITELRLSPAEAYRHLARIIEAANVVMSSLYTADLMSALSSGSTAAAPQLMPSAMSAGGPGAGGAAEAEGAKEDASAERELTLDGPSSSSSTSSSSSSMSSLEGQQAASAAAGGGDGRHVVATDGWAIQMDEKEEARLFFDPAKGNVVFASAYDGWAFSVDDFAKLHAPRLDLSRALLRRALWGEYFYRPKSKKIVTGGGLSASATAKPLAVAMMLEPLWAVYDCCVLNPNEERQGKIVKSLGLEGKLNKRDMASKEGSVRAQAILRGWMPLSECVLGMVVRALPSPKEAQALRLPKLWPVVAAAAGAGALSAAEAAESSGGGAGAVGPGTSLSPAPLTAGMPLAERIARVRAAIAACDTSPDADCVLFVSKMFAVPKDSLPALDDAYDGTAAATSEGASVAAGGANSSFPAALSALRPEAWYGLEGCGIGDPPGSALDLAPVAASVRRAGALRSSVSSSSSSSSSMSGGAAGLAIEDEDDANNAETFIAFARVFSGVLTPDKPVFVLGPRYEPGDPASGAGSGAGAHHISLVTRPLPLYLMMGRDLSPLPAAYAGSIVGIGRLGSHVLKSATLCTTPACASLSPMTFQTTPLVRVAIEPRAPHDLAALERGLALLDAADPCVEIGVSEAGELQLAALGELHLQRCVTDLQTRFARGVEISVSAPILSFQETIVSGAKPQAIPGAVAAAITASQRAAAALASVAAAAAAAAMAGNVGSPTVSSSTATVAAGASDAAAEEEGPVGGGGGRRGGGAPPSSAQSAAAANPFAPFRLYPPGQGPQISACWAFPPEGSSSSGGSVLHLPTGVVHSATPDRSCTLRITARPLPGPITRLLQENAGALRALAAEGKRASGASRGMGSANGGAVSVAPAVTALAARIAVLAEEAGGDWPALIRSTWGFGPKGYGPNIFASRLCSSSSSSSAVAGAGANASGGGVQAQIAQLLQALGAPPDAAAVASVDASLQSVWAAAGVASAFAAASSIPVLETSEPPSPSPSPPSSLPPSLPSSLPPSLVPTLTTLRSALMQGFNLAAGAGPLCGEPLWGVCIVLEGLSLKGSGGAAGDSPTAAAAAVGAAADAASPTPSTPSSLPAAPAVYLSSGGLMSTMRDGCRSALESGAPRLAEALYRCELQCSGGRGGGGEALGKCYGVLAKRRARVLDEDVAEGTSTFVISALLPVASAPGFADELRTRTSGAATAPQLLFSHWEVLDIDPWGEGEDDGSGGAGGDDDGAAGGGGGGGSGSGATTGMGGDTATGARNLARRFIDAVRVRKGLPLDRKLVAHADKQRNLSRKK